MNHIARISQALGNLPAILLTSDSNCFYATGFMGEGMALITREGSWYFTDSRYTEAAGKAIGDAAVIEQISAKRPFTVCINDVLTVHGIKTVGYEDAAVTVAAYNDLSAKLKADMVGASDLMKELRAVKDDEEIRRLTAAQRIAEKALEQICREIQPGMTEKHIAARLTYLMMEYGAHKNSFDPIVASGPNGSMPHAVPTDRQVQPGEFVTMDFGCIYEGYCSDMTRTVCVGEPTEEMRKVYNTVLEAQLAGIAAAKAGVSGADIDGAARKVIEDAGYGQYFGHSFGHSLGIDIHEAPNNAPSNHNPMPDGAVTSAEPGIYIPGKFGVRIEDVMVIKADGSHLITQAPKALLVL